MRIAFATFGCKINHYETEMMQQSVTGTGNVVVPFGEDADVYVVNTCSVTAKSDSQCRQAIRSATRRKGTARVLVTGCYAETRPHEIRAIPGVSHIVGMQEKADIVRYLPRSGGAASPSAAGLLDVPMRTRAFLKIQDGCDSRCSYCIIPMARGGSRSVPYGEVIRCFDGMVASAAPEIVVSGIHIGRYGSDLAPRSSLADLLRDLVGRKGNSRIRLSSIEPNEVTPEIIAMLGRGLCRHLHIPLQSGDDGILRAMNRRYTTGAYRDLIGSLAVRVPGMALGADVMVGFPGEGEREFENTMKLIEDLPLSNLHVFSYSPRQGTPAAAMKGQVPETVKQERNALLRQLGRKKNLEFRRRFLGTKLNVVVENKKTAEIGIRTGLTDNYIRVSVRGGVEDTGCREIVVLINEVHKDVTLGYEIR
jgi:threonylcarbamoyladenosine tRNA methylthiotransferase MtaB